MPMCLWETEICKYLWEQQRNSHWLDKQKAPPQAHAIGWASVAVSGWSNKQSQGFYLSGNLQIDYCQLDLHIKPGKV